MTRETFGSRVGVVLTMVGVAVGLGNVWRFPYMVGKFGGAAFVIVYLALVLLLGVPALMAEWALGRSTGRGTVGAFERGGLPGGRWVGWFLFVVVIAATGYYTNVLGWVLYHAVGQLAGSAGLPFDAAAVLPPDTGFAPRSFLLQLILTGLVAGLCGLVLVRGLRRGIERLSRWLMPLLLGGLVVVAVRSITLPGAGAGLHWLLFRFSPEELDARVVIAAMGQAIFSLSLGGTFMVVYGSYLPPGERLAPGAAATALGDTAAGLLAGLAIFPAVFALGLEPAQGPGLLFGTLPESFARMPAGGLFGAVFFLALFGAAYLSDVAAFEVLVAGLADNTRLSRRQAVGLVVAAVWLAAIPPMINLEIFVPWDLTFGSGMQTVGALLSVLTLGWCADRSAALRELGGSGAGVLYFWIRFVIPGAILAVGGWWLATEVFGLAAGV
ncbi:MAG: sodium-dependent transporter [Gemmatimonadales bacterium]